MILNKRPVGPCAAMPVGRALFRMGIGTLAQGRLDSHQGPFVMRQEAGPHQVFARVVHSFALVFVRAVAIPQAGVFHQPVDVLGRILFHVACPAEIVGHESLHAVSSGGLRTPVRAAGKGRRTTAGASFRPPRGCPDDPDPVCSIPKEPAAGRSGGS